MKTRAIYIGICGLLLGAIVHICIIFLIPLLGEKDAAKRIVNNSQTNRFEKLTASSKIGLSNGDPFFQLSTCKFDLADSGVEVTGDRTDLFWSASVFSSRGRVLYSLNERTAIGNKLRMIVVNPIQMASIRQIQPEELETSIVVETSEQVGFIIVRALKRDQSWASTVDGFLGSLQCLPYTGQS
ncbi:MAG: hypothetical protein AAGA76_04210 [Pseudomonadota bacterium]